MVGETATGSYYEVEPSILVHLCKPGVTDDGVSARQNIEFQISRFRSFGIKGAVIMDIEPIIGQTAEARDIYTSASNEHLVATSLVGVSMLARAIGNFFIGMRKPFVALRMHTTVDEGIDWARRIVAEAMTEISSDDHCGGRPS